MTKNFCIRGRYLRPATKTRVESCCCVRLGDLVLKRPNSRGILSWTRDGKPFGAITWVMGEDQKFIRFEYLLRDKPFQDLVEFVFSKTGGDGVRWWFGCPGCRRSCSRLYLPPDGNRFRCRTCHQLTYESAQEAHSYERAYGCDSETARLLRRRDKAEYLERVSGQI